MAKISRNTFIVSTVLAAGVPASGFASEGLWVWAISNILCGLLLIFGQALRFRWTGYPGLIFFVISYTRCAFLEIPSEWLLLGLTASLSMWDLHLFMWRLHLADIIEKKEVLERRHLKRLMITLGSGLVAGAAALKADMNIRFGWMLLLGIVLVIGLSRLIERVGRGGD